jgi:hypothetical protein
MPKGELGGELPWQVHAFAGQKGARMQWYKTTMLAALAGTAAWLYYSKRGEKSRQGEGAGSYGQPSAVFLHWVLPGRAEFHIQWCTLGACQLGLQRSTNKILGIRAEEAAERFGRHGEKAQLGRDFGKTVQKAKDHFPGIPSTETNASGSHTGGAKSGF